jgi:hypothetical protein
VVRAVLRHVRDEVADTYERYSWGRDFVRSDLRASIDEGIESVAPQPPSAGRRAVLAALTLLRLDLVPVAEPDVPEAVAA